MRDIKFRGKRTDNGEWVYGDLLTNRSPIIEILANDGTYTVDPETVGQFTGLFDKNGKPVYECDIIQGYIYPHRHVIEWNDKKARFIAKLIGYEMMNDCGVEQFWIDECEKIVIGNKWDNPELLKGNKNGKN